MMLETINANNGGKAKISRYMNVEQRKATLSNAHENWLPQYH